MAIVKFCLDNGASIDSCRTKTIDTVKDLKLEEGKWESLSEDDRYKLVEEWANNYIEIFWEYV